MKRLYRSSLIYLVLGIILLQTAYMTFTARQPVVFRNEHEQVVGVRDLTVSFRIISWAALIIGLLMIVGAIATWFRPHAKEKMGHNVFGAELRLFAAGPVWMLFNALLILLSVWAGYAEMSPSKLQHTNPDLILCVCIVILLPLFVIGTLHLSKADRLRRPSLNRFPLNWSGDPLQALFISTLCCLGLFIGSLSRVIDSGALGFWTVAFYCSLFFGLLTGQLVAYRLYRSRIEGN
jgi:hypothetical protein